MSDQHHTGTSNQLMCFLLLFGKQNIFISPQMPKQYSILDTNFYEPGYSDLDNTS